MNSFKTLFFGIRKRVGGIGRYFSKEGGFCM